MQNMQNMHQDKKQAKIPHGQRGSRHNEVNIDMGDMEDIGALLAMAGVHNIPVMPTISGTGGKMTINGVPVDDLSNPSGSGQQVFTSADGSTVIIVSNTRSKTRHYSNKGRTP